MHIVLARKIAKWTHAVDAARWFHGSVNICSPDASACGNSSLVAFSNRSRCARTPGSARTCSSRVMDIDVSAIVTDGAALLKRACDDRDGLCACADDLPGSRARMCRGQSMILLPRNTGSGTAPIHCGGQTGRPICRGNRDSALIRKVKSPTIVCRVMPFDISPDLASRSLGRVKHGGKTVIGSQIGGR